MNSKKIMCVCAAMILLLQTGCLSGGRSVPAYGHPQQPPYLKLPGSQPVKTLDGEYTPARNETWMNPSVLAEKDAIILEQQRALERAGILPLLPR